MLIAYRNSESEEAQALVADGIDNVRRDLLSDTAKVPTVWASLARKMGFAATRSVHCRTVVAQLFLKQVQTSLPINEWDKRSTIGLITLLTESLTSRRFAVENSSRTGILLRT